MERKIEVKLDDNDEVLEREVKDGKTSGRIIIPKKYIGTKATIICSGEKE